MDHRQMADQHLVADQGRDSPSHGPGAANRRGCTLPSWMLVRAPIRIRLTSPRSTQLYQMLASGPISMSPISRAPGATKAAGSIARRLAAEAGSGSSPKLPWLDVVDDGRVELGEARIVIIELGPPGHAEPLHQPPARHILAEGDRDDARRRRACRRRSRARRSPLPWHSPAPRHPRAAASRPRASPSIGLPAVSAILIPQKPSSSPSALRSTDPEGEAALLLPAHHPLADRSVDRRLGLHAAEPAHHRGRVGVADERLDVLLAPVAQDQPLGLDHRPTHMPTAGERKLMIGRIEA